MPAEHVEGLYSCLDYYQDVDDPFSKELLERYDGLFPGSAQFTGGGACSGLYRGLRLWEAAVTEAGSLDQDAVIAALDHAKIAAGPGRAGRDGARPAPRAHEHVHRAGEAEHASALRSCFFRANSRTTRPRRSPGTKTPSASNTSPAPTS